MPLWLGRSGDPALAGDGSPLGHMLAEGWTHSLGLMGPEPCNRFWGTQVPDPLDRGLPVAVPGLCDVAAWPWGRWERTISPLGLSGGCQPSRRLTAGIGHLRGVRHGFAHLPGPAQCGWAPGVVQRPSHCHQGWGCRPGQPRRHKRAPQTGQRKHLRLIAPGAASLRSGRRQGQFLVSPASWPGLTGWTEL